MKSLYLFLFILMISIIFIGCESKEMKDAKDFISLKDWENAIEKLQLEIKNKPKNVEAYKLLFIAQKNLYFSDFNLNLFLNPNKATIDSFPKLNNEGAVKLFTTMDRIEKIDPKAIEPDYLFFRALYNYYEWYYEWDIVINLLLEKVDILNYFDIKDSLYVKRFENEDFNESIYHFKKCINIESDISDNAFYWLYSIQDDTSYKVFNLIEDFRQKYSNSDLNYEIDLLEFKENLRTIVNEYFDKPDSISIIKPLELISSFLKVYPSYKTENVFLGALLVDYVVSSNREYISYNKYKYSNATGLIKYLKEITKSYLNETIKISALERIAEYYENTKENKKQIEIYKEILDFNLNEEMSDDIHYKIGKAFHSTGDFKNSVLHFKKIKNLSDIQKYNLWECHNKLNNKKEADKLRSELEESEDVLVRSLIKLSSYISDRQNLNISGLDAEFDSYSINVIGYIVNNMPYTVYNVKVRAEVSDEYGNNTKEGFDYIDIIYPGKKSLFKISVYYGDNRPNSIKYSANIVDFSK